MGHAKVQAFHEEVNALDEAKRYREKRQENIWDDDEVEAQETPAYSKKKELSRKKQQEAAEFLGVEP